MIEKQITSNSMSCSSDASRAHWKWMIAISCCWVNMFIFGVFRSAGVLYIAFIVEFGCTYREASWPISLAGSVASITGIAAGFLSHYFTVRTLVFIGVFICSFATSICYFAPDILFIIIALGIIQGIGIGLVTTLLPAIISQYFGKQRALACGISYAGATIGAFIFPLFIDWQLQQFGLRGTLLLMGGITLHGLIGALLLRPLVASNGSVTDKNRREKAFDNNTQDVIDNKLPLIEECETVVFLENSNHQYENIHSVRKFRERPKSMTDFNPSVKMRDNYHNVERNRANRLSMPITPITAERKIAINAINGKTISNNVINNRRYNDTFVEQSSSLYRSVCANLLNDSKILISAHFALCTITYITFIIDFVAFLIILPDFAHDRGLIGREGTILLSLYSITDLFGRLIPGLISYLDILANKNIYIISIAIMGLCFILMPIVANSFLVISVITLICGFVGGCQMVLPPVVLSEYFGAEKTAVAFGLSNFLCGILALIFRPILIGLKDKSGDYTALFYIMGSLALLSALFWILDSIRAFICKSFIKLF